MGLISKHNIEVIASKVFAAKGAAAAEEVFQELTTGVASTGGAAGASAGGAKGSAPAPAPEQAAAPAPASAPKRKGLFGFLG
jgi:hypothetical protein